MKVPHEIRRCKCCGFTAMVKSDAVFKGVQVDPASADITWFCEKEVCREAMDAAVEEAMERWNL